MSRALIQQLRDALDESRYIDRNNKAIAAADAALAQPETDPFEQAAQEHVRIHGANSVFASPEVRFGAPPLAQPEQEPVAWALLFKNAPHKGKLHRVAWQELNLDSYEERECEVVPLSAAPPVPALVPITRAQVGIIVGNAWDKAERETELYGTDACDGDWSPETEWTRFGEYVTRAVEAHHGIKPRAAQETPK